MSDQEKVSLANPPQPGEPDYVVPTDLVPLPSKGKIYPAGSPLHNQETIEIRSMTAKDEDILTSRALLKTGRAVSMLMKSCVIDKRIDPDQMVSGDRNALLVAIRITGYGAEYDVKQLECPECGAKSPHTFNLAKLKIKPLGKEPVGGKNEFEVDLPVCKKKAVYKLLTGAEEKDLSDALEALKKSVGPGGVESAVTTRLLYSLVSLGGETDRTKLSNLVRNLPARDSKVLRADMDRTAPGVDLTQSFDCPECGEESEVSVPFGTEFFWPEA